MRQDIPAAVGAGRAPSTASDGSSFQHWMTPYRGAAEYRRAVAHFVRNALDAGERVLLAVPRQHASVLAEVVGGDSERLIHVDMSELGRNPARIIPFVQAFLERYRGEPVSYLGEPAWPGRSGAELAEAMKHEALVNLAFHQVPVTIMCPYDACGLPADLLADAERTHPLIAVGGATRPSPAYLGHRRMPRSCDQPLPSPPPDARVVVYRDSLRELRALVARCAEEAGLGADRTADLVLATSEIAANTLRHTADGGTLRVWRTGREILCQIEDGGVITDALAGRVRPAGGEPSGHGLWLVNQVCDLVEVRSRADGTTIRLRMALDRLQGARAATGGPGREFRRGQVLLLI